MYRIAELRHLDNEMPKLTIPNHAAPILAGLVLRRITEWQYGIWPGDEIVQIYVDLYSLLNPGDAAWISVENIKANRPHHYTNAIKEGETA